MPPDSIELVDRAEQQAGAQAATASGERAARSRLDRPAAHFLAVVILTSLATLWAASTPWNDWGILFLVGPLWLLLAGAWLISFFVALHRDLYRFRRWRIWLVAPVVVVLTLLAMDANLPVWARFAASRPAFDQLVSEQVVANGPVGLYDVSDFERTDVGFEVTVSCGGLDWCSGFAYSPAIAPEPLTRIRGDDEPSYWHIDGPWYMWVLAYGD